MLRLGITCVIVCLIAGAAVAAPFPPVEVTTGRDTSGHIACKVQHKAFAAVIADAVRNERVQIATASQIADYEAIEAHVEILAEYTTDGCAVSLIFRFQSNQPVMVAAELGLRRVDLILCEKLELLSGVPETLPKRVDAWLRAVVGECISEVQREA